MRQRIVFERTARKRALAPDNVPIQLPVDQYPVQKFNISDYGFPKSDITIFDEMQKGQCMDMSLYAQFAARLGKVIAERPNGIKLWLDESHSKLNPEAIAQFTQRYRPAWIQTQAEEKQFIDWFCQEYDMPLLRKMQDDKDQELEPEPELKPEPNLNPE